MEVRSVEPAALYGALAALKAEGFNVLVDLTALDLSKSDPSGPRFKVVYRLMKLDPATGREGGRLAVECRVGAETGILKSAAPLWPAADWLEREVWDMFGVPFADRPGIKRLLLYEEFQGHPLRKDYPIAKRQPLIGPASGEAAQNPSFNAIRPALRGE